MDFIMGCRVDKGQTSSQEMEASYRRFAICRSSIIGGCSKKSFSYFEFGENYNFSWWRVQQSEESPKKIRGYLSIHKGEIYYKKKPLKFIHTHLNNKRYGGFNNLMLSMLHHCKKYRELLCVQRMVDNKWTIQIPRQTYGWSVEARE